MNASSRPMTAAELIQLSSPGKRFELRRGELIVMVSAGAKHGQVAMQVGHILADFVRRHELGTVFGAETGFRLERDPDTVLAPDVAFVSTARMPPESIPSSYGSGPRGRGDLPR